MDGDEMNSLLSAGHGCRWRSLKSVASRSLLDWRLPCVTHGSSMLHSLLASDCLHIPPSFPPFSQPHSPSSSCLPLSFPEAWILLPTRLPLLFTFPNRLYILFTFYLFHQCTPPFPRLASSFLSLLLICFLLHINGVTTLRCISWSSVSIS